MAARILSLASSLIGSPSNIRSPPASNWAIIRSKSLAISRSSFSVRAGGFSSISSVLQQIQDGFTFSTLAIASITGILILSIVPFSYLYTVDLATPISWAISSSVSPRALLRLSIRAPISSFFIFPPPLDTMIIPQIIAQCNIKMKIDIKKLRNAIDITLR